MMYPVTQTIDIFQVLLGTDSAQGFLQCAVVDWLLFSLGEKIRYNPVEELQVVL